MSRPLGTCPILPQSSSAHLVLLNGVSVEKSRCPGGWFSPRQASETLSPYGSLKTSPSPHPRLLGPSSLRQGAGDSHSSISLAQQTLSRKAPQQAFLEGGAGLTVLQAPCQSPGAQKGLDRGQGGQVDVQHVGGGDFGSYCTNPLIS